jgi:isocitrate/isopropylmalate dehydrogenase
VFRDAKLGFQRPSGLFGGRAYWPESSLDFLRRVADSVGLAEDVGGSTMPYDIALLPGDGIGPEVMAESQKILTTLEEIFAFDFRFESIPCGGKYYLEHGRKNDWPEGSQQKCKDADAILLAAVGWPSPDGPGPVTMSNGKMAGYSPVIGNRVNLDLYANVRPVELYEGVPHIIHGRAMQVWDPDKVNMIFVRENTEGLYAGVGGMLQRGGEAVMAVDNRLITRVASERVIRFAFELCKDRNQGSPFDGKPRVTAIVKDNVMDGCRLFRDIFFDVAKEYPKIETGKDIVDAFTQWLMKEPEKYDVCVTTNLFGDVVTDLASVLQGGMGLAVGNNIGDHHGMFEPIHGSAPPLAGKDCANPMAMILSTKEALGWLGRRNKDEQLCQAADLVDRAVREQVKAGQILTADIIGEDKASPCTEVGNEVIRRVKSFA